MFQNRTMYSLNSKPFIKCNVYSAFERVDQLISLINHIQMYAAYCFSCLSCRVLLRRTTT